MSAAIRAAIVAKLQTVADIGRVHGYERYSATDKTFRELYVTGDTLSGWHVRRVARKEDAAYNQATTTWELRGIRALVDAEASELAFDAVIDGICAAWRDDPTLDGAVLYPRGEEAVVPELVDAGPVLFAGVLCHSARLRLITRHVCPAGRPWD